MSPAPRLVIAGTHSGVGKTTVATAVMAALARRGLCVQPFKVGPDFIDPGFHEAACGRPSRNLDGWMLSRARNLEIFARASEGADVAVIEGVMGLFDGRSAAAEDGSTAEMAKWLGAPVVLVADASAMARSAAALVRGFETFDPQMVLAGVVFNRVGGPRHGDLLREAVRAYCGAATLGGLPRNDNLSMPSRHLGLHMAAEALTPECLAEMAAWVERDLDLDGLLALARERSAAIELQAAAPRACPPARVRIAIARDRAFCFYYQDNLDLLREYGAELVEFSPMEDGGLPAGIGGVYLGGGYPEVHAERLAANRPVLQAVRNFAAAGGPIYAECGGFMYLTEAIIDAERREHSMAGLFPTRARMGERLAALGYREVAGPDGATARGHEFRYSAIDPMPAGVERVYRDPAQGYRVNSVVGSYIHLHWLSCPNFAERFVEECAGWRRKAGAQ